jgi:uncharacterized membrane protein
LPTPRITHTATPAPRYGRDEAEFGRAVAFFDATFAIAATLLVTTLDPGARGWSSWRNLSHAVDGPLLAFAISFVVIASYCWSDHRFVASLRALSAGVIICLLWLLGFVVLLPFTTDGLGENLGSDEVTTVVYAINVALVSTTEWIAYRIAVHDDLFRQPPTNTEVLASSVCQLLPSAVFLASVPVALFWSPAAARWAWLSLLILSPLAGRWAQRQITPRERGTDG